MLKCRRPSAAHPLPLRCRSACGFRGSVLSLWRNFQINHIMSKRNMLLGLAAGKIGDLVFYRDGGEQRTRTRVVPKNPRSQAQMAQRVRIANVSATYRLLKAVIADSFTGRPSNQSGYNAFAGSAIEMSPYLNREMALANAVIPAPYVIARGTLMSVPYLFNYNELKTSVILPIADLTEEDTTVAAVSTKLLNAYPQLQQGDVLTFVGIEYFPINGEDAADGYRANSQIISFKVDASDTSVLPSDRYESAVGQLKVIATSDSNVAANSMIVSRTDGSGALQVSGALLVLSDDATQVYESYRNPDALNKAVESYGVGSESIFRE